VPARVERTFGRGRAAGRLARAAHEDRVPLQRDDLRPGQVEGRLAAAAHHQPNDGRVDLLGVRDQVDRAPEQAPVVGAEHALREQLGEKDEHPQTPPPWPIIATEWVNAR